MPVAAQELQAFLTLRSCGASLPSLQNPGGEVSVSSGEGGELQRALNHRAGFVQEQTGKFKGSTSCAFGSLNFLRIRGAQKA